jgi:hypothetical protein
VRGFGSAESVAFGAARQAAVAFGAGSV